MVFKQFSLNCRKVFFSRFQVWLRCHFFHIESALQIFNPMSLKIAFDVEKGIEKK